MGCRYCVLGAGRQGTAAAYDLGRFGRARDIALADVDLSRAEAASERVNELLSAPVSAAARVDATEAGSLERAFEEFDLVVSAVPYAHNLRVAEAAIRAGASMVDLGGNTDIVRRELALDALALEAGVALVPDCGMGPGMNVSLLVHAMGQLDDPLDAYVFDGGLPQHPEPPWNYALTFNVEGLTNEYTGEAVFLREGKIVRVPALGEPEVVEIPPLGTLEALVTAGGLSTAPWTFEGTLRTLENKTLRHPGHWDRIRAFHDLGLLDLKPINVDGAEVVPRHVFHALFEPRVARGRLEDVAVIRVRVAGAKTGEPTEVLVDLVDRYDPTTGFTAMERVTGWHASIIAQAIASGEVPPGARPVESALPAERVVEEARRRGLAITETVRPLGTKG
jgi:lysine 6-dehydrogenase